MYVKRNKGVKPCEFYKLNRAKPMMDRYYDYELENMSEQFFSDNANLDHRKTCSLFGRNKRPEFIYYKCVKSGMFLLKTKEQIVNESWLNVNNLVSRPTTNPKDVKEFFVELHPHIKRNGRRENYVLRKLQDSIETGVKISEEALLQEWFSNHYKDVFTGNVKLCKKNAKIYRKKGFNKVVFTTYIVHVTNIIITDLKKFEN